MNTNLSKVILVLLYKKIIINIFILSYFKWKFFFPCTGDHCGRDCMVVRFTTTYMQSVPITTKVVSSNPTHGKVYSLQLYVMKFVSDLWQVCGFLLLFQFPPPRKLTHDITEILFKAALNIVVLIQPMYKLDLFDVKQNSRLKYISKIKLSKLSPY
jgi:hypothetical protein